jgi:ABC-2 type transport system ATP-binding protein
MRNAIELRNVTWRAGKAFAIEDLSLNVPRGSIYGFLGPNGSGKTTTIRMITGMVKPAAGEIRVLDGRVPKDLPQILARTGYVPERPHVYSGVTVDEALRYHAAFYPHWDRKWAEQLADQLGLDLERRVGRMSKGETGKLLILLALSQRPDLLILDEPTDGLDPVIRRDVITAVLDYVSDTGATVFISSHLVHELERICDWVGVMDGGRLVAELPMQMFKNGIKRLRVTNPPSAASPLADLPFVLLSRDAGAGTRDGETWVVRGWEDPMRGYFARVGAEVRDVIDLDLEEGFVELLRSSRPSPRNNGNGS